MGILQIIVPPYLNRIGEALGINFQSCAVGLKPTSALIYGIHSLAHLWLNNNINYYQSK
jgi:hypothetical protein